MVTDLTIEAMGARGEGVAHRNGTRVYIPYTLPGERVRADVHGERARMAEVIDAAPDRVSAACRHFGRCGGCLLQHWSAPSYARWKRQLVVDALSRKGMSGVEIAPLVDAHGAGRRRVTLTVASGRAGFSAHRSHTHVPIDTCPVLVPQLAQGPEIAVALVEALKLKKPQRVYLMASDTGIDCDLAGVDDPDLDARVRIADVAEKFDLARVCGSGDMLIERARPVLHVDGTTVTPPPGGFAQATAAGEAALAAIVVPALAQHAVVADLFCGWGAFGLRLAKASRVLAVDADKAVIAALQAATRAATGLKPVIARARDLMRDPLTATELKGITAAVFDPPRAGAARQAAELAAAEGVRTVVGVSCDASTFARDANILVEGGFRLDRVVPVDQFRYTAHVEMVGIFSR